LHADKSTDRLINQQGSDRCSSSHESSAGRTRYSGVATLFRRKRELRPRVAGRDRVRRDDKSIIVQFGSALAYLFIYLFIYYKIVH